MKLSVVIPCYNEEENVKLLHERIKEVFGKEKIELVFINDGSSDKTLTNLEKIVKESIYTVKVIDFSRNFGKEAAIYAGLSKARGEYISVIDSDMQQDPLYIKDMVSFLEQNSEYDSVAMYQEKRRESILSKVLKKGFYRFINRISDTKFREDASDFRTFRSYVVKEALNLKEYYRFSKGIFSWIGFNTYYMSYKVKKRATGSTKWSIKSLFRYAIDGIISFTTAPLRMATYVGLFTSFASIVYLIVVVVQKIFFGIDIPGYATIITLILLLGGIQLFFLGVIGEYVGRSYIELKRRPIYIEKKIITNEGKHD